MPRRCGVQEYASSWLLDFLDLHDFSLAILGQKDEVFEPFQEPEAHPDLARWRANVGEPLALDLAPPLQRKPREVDVLCWNLAIGAARLGEVVELWRSGEWSVSDSDPDRPLVVLAQEAFRADDSIPARVASRFHGGASARAGAGDLAELARQNGLSLRYAPSMRNGADRSDRGNAVLATAALQGAHAFSLPHVRQRRVAVAAELTELQGMTFVSAHLDTWGALRTDRRRPVWPFGSGRVAQAADLGRRLVASDGDGVVVGGDLNTPLGRRDPVLGALVHAGFTPARPVGAWQHTFHGPVRLLLDHVLFRSRGGWVRAVEVRRLDETAADRGRRVFGSDHHPLLARVVLR
ncbi:hypothetical protein BH23GEM4_BH23GEM4_09210 [soil metagenome]